MIIVYKYQHAQLVSISFFTCIIFKRMCLKKRGGWWMLLLLHHWHPSLNPEGYWSNRSLWTDRRRAAINVFAVLNMPHVYAVPS